MELKKILVICFFLFFFIFSVFEPFHLKRKGIFATYSDSKILSESFFSKYQNLSLAYKLYYNYSITKDEKALIEAKKIFSNQTGLINEFNKLLQEEKVQNAQSILLQSENFSLVPIFLIFAISYSLNFIFRKKVELLPILSVAIVFPFLIIFGVDEFNILALISSFIISFFELQKKETILVIAILSFFSIVLYFLNFSSFEYFALLALANICRIFVRR